MSNTSPYRRRPGHCWEPVLSVSGLRGMVSFEGSVRAFYECGEELHVKGRVTFEKWTGSPTSYRFSYRGFTPHNEKDVVGSVDFPSSPWQLTKSKGESANMKGRLLLMSFNARDTRDGLQRIQVMIPTLQGGHMGAKTVIQAIEAANIELCSGDHLVGRRI